MGRWLDYARYSPMSSLRRQAAVHGAQTAFRNRPLPEVRHAVSMFVSGRSNSVVDEIFVMGLQAREG
jgi:hypothetical protein